MISLTVCLLTAGKGSRLGSYSKSLNKALLPINRKAVISHIIEKFPQHTEFVVGVGFLGDQVRQYLSIAHSDHHFTFVDVDNFDGPGSGPGYSLLCCSKYLQKPFYFVSCDTLWENTLDWDQDSNWLGVAPVTSDITQHYCNLKVVDGRITDLRDKEKIHDPMYQAFVGLCFIRDYTLFWDALGTTKTIAGEHQVSNGLTTLIQNTKVCAESIVWTDVGDFEKYKAAVQKYEDFDFGKQNESLYIVNNKVIKFFADASLAQKRVKKSALNPIVFPVISDYQGSFYAYHFQPGKTLYEVNSSQIFDALISWLDKKLWQPVHVSNSIMQSACATFYHDKTMERIAMFHAKYPESNTSLCINDKSIPAIYDLFSKISWESLNEGFPSFIHGDLQFDNILYDERSCSFMLLDWRQDFGGHVEFGDLYYDLAKLYGGIILNYDYIKQNLMRYEEDANGIHFDFAQRYQTHNYQTILDQYIVSKGYDLKKVQLIVALIYLNMSPLHHYPFDKLLYALGSEFLYAHVGT